MNVYDFDDTIYDGDSMLDFYRFAVKRQPLLLRFLPEQIWGIIRYHLGFGTKERMKEHFYAFLRGIDDIDQMVADFWQSHQSRIKNWYLAQKQSTDVIISASAEFLLQPICQQLHIQLMASHVDERTGAYTGLNCRGKEKVRRYQEKYHDEPIQAFYSDSDADIPLAKLAQKAYKVCGNKVTRWDVKS